MKIFSIVLLLSLSFSPVSLKSSSVQVFSKSKWITVDDWENDAKRTVPVFVKEFEIYELTNRGILNITTLGIYEVILNGQRISRDYFVPGFTVYDKRLQYQTYNVERILRKGKNVLHVYLAEGWYKGVFRNLTSDTSKNNFGMKLGLLCELKFGGTHLKNENQIVSDSSWRYAKSGIKYASFYGGEFFDNGYELQDWSPVKLVSTKEVFANNMRIVKSISPPVRKQFVFKPRRIYVSPKGEQLVDFGQNLAGFVRIMVRGKIGDTIRICHAEILDSDGNFYAGNLRNAQAEDVYVLKGNGLEILEPHFTYHGFRFAKITGMKATLWNCVAQSLYSDLETTGFFSCSNTLLNKLQENIVWSMNSNFVEIPTDCPQRSERLGWTGDAQVFAATASFLRNTKSFYSKWLEDVAVEQAANGAIPNFVPTSSPYRENFNGVAGWGDVATILPWRLFEVYGDTALLAKHYSMMKKWVDYITSVSPNKLFKKKGYGDWYAMGDSTSVNYINQCYYAHSTGLLVKAAKILGKAEDSETYNKLLSQIKEAFIKEYWSTRPIGVDTQTAYVLALEFDMLPVNLRSVAVDRLVKLITSNGNKLATGFLGTPHLLKVLSENGHSGLAYNLLLQTECPSWLYPITKGATTIWERWDAIRPDGSVQETSFNHYAYGAVGQWMYENIAGISPLSPGYSAVKIKPIVGGNLRWAKGSYLTRYGLISSHWEIANGKIILKVKVPKGVTAEVWVPGDSKPRMVNEGNYTFKNTHKSQT